VQWSFSALKMFKNCPKQFHQLRIEKNYPPSPPSEQMLYGSAVHKAIEDYLTDGTPLAKNYQHMLPSIRPIANIPGKRYVEYQMALDGDRKPTDFMSSTYWVRGIADLLVLDGPIAWIVDWKTGNPKFPDKDQLKLMALMVFKIFPEVQEVRGALVFLGRSAFFDAKYLRELEAEYWQTFESQLKQIDLFRLNGSWPEKSGPLCNYCPVVDCLHNPKSR
jgi:hypothetical protein